MATTSAFKRLLWSLVTSPQVLGSAQNASSRVHSSLNLLRSPAPCRRCTRFRCSSHLYAHACTLALVRVCYTPSAVQETTNPKKDVDSCRGRWMEEGMARQRERGGTLLPSANARSSLPCPAADPRSPPQPPLTLFARRVHAALDSTPPSCPIDSTSASRWCLRPQAVADTLSPPPRLSRTQACSNRAASAMARWTRPGLEHYKLLVSLAPPPCPSPGGLAVGIGPLGLRRGPSTTCTRKLFVDAPGPRSARYMHPPVFGGRVAGTGARVRLDTGFTPLVPQTAKLAIWESGALLLARPTAQPADTARRPPCATQRRSALAPFTAPPSERKLPHPAVRSGTPIPTECSALPMYTRVLQPESFRLVARCHGRALASFAQPSPSSGLALLARNWPPALQGLGSFQLQAVSSGLVQVRARFAMDQARSLALGNPKCPIDSLPRSTATLDVSSSYTGLDDSQGTCLRRWRWKSSAATRSPRWEDRTAPRAPDSAGAISERLTNGVSLPNVPRVSFPAGSSASIAGTREAVLGMELQIYRRAGKHGYARQARGGAARSWGAAHRDALARPILLPMFLLPQKLARLYRSIFWRPSRAGLDSLFFFASC
ncbi:hypothetical protein B0H14DRAFT_3590277 [Mycena olivaceomarginata]|nr:hypothetical protein B0H14DRAFT_3590277 [Mycena olivaceomarginata]